MREWFKNYKPGGESAAIIITANSIIRDYMRQGYKLTLRQLYYQFVARDLIPNTEKSYKRLGSIVSRARLGGLMDWDAIEDRARRPESPPQFNSLEDLVEAAFHTYRLPRLAGQDTYIELWVEKDALASVLAPIARRYHVTLMVNRGYSSSSAMKESAERITQECNEHDIYDAVILYLGDLDPSGEDMVRDIRERQEDFLNGGRLVETKNGKAVVETAEDRRSRQLHTDLSVEKIALTIEQVQQYDPPPNPAKVTDPRATSYIEKYGSSSWEVDALAPPVLRQIIEETIERYIDMDLMEEIKEQEETDKARLREALKEMK